MKILVTGAKGMLGQDLCPILEDADFVDEVVETDIDNLDITNKASNLLLWKEHLVILREGITKRNKKKL